MKKIQIFNPKLKRYVLLDDETGKIISIKSNKEPYKNIPIWNQEGY